MRWRARRICHFWDCFLGEAGRWRTKFGSCNGVGSFALRPTRCSKGSHIVLLKTGLTVPTHSIFYFRLFENMGFVGIFGLCVTVLAVCGVVICFRCLLPCYIIPNISTLLNDVEQSLTSAVTIGAIATVSKEREDLETYGTLHSRVSSSH